MPDYSRYSPEIMTHDPKAFAQRSIAVGCGSSFLQIINQNIINEYILSGMLQALQAPVVISRESVFQIISGSYPAQSYKCLMADKHPFGKRFILEILWRSKMTGANILTVTIHQICLTIHNTGHIIFCNSVKNSTQSSRGMKCIAGIKETYSIFRMLYSYPCSWHHIYLRQVRI